MATSKITKISPKDAEAILFKRETNLAGEVIKLSAIRTVGNKNLVYEAKPEDLLLTNEQLLQKIGLEVDKGYDAKILILIAAMVYGVDFKARYGMTAPYTHSYYVQSPLVKNGYTYAVVSSAPFVTKDGEYGLPNQLYKYLAKNHPDYDYGDLVKRIHEAISELGFGDKEMKQNDSYQPYKVSNGYEEGLSEEAVLDVIRGRCSGTYSTGTPVRQNDLSEQLFRLRYAPAFEPALEKAILRQEDEAVFDLIKKFKKESGYK